MTLRRRHPLATMWIYTGLRFALLAVLFVLLWLLGLNGWVAAFVALALSVPLSYVLLARPRRAMAESVEERLAQRRARNDELDQQLAGQDDGDSVEGRQR